MSSISSKPYPYFSAYFVWPSPLTIDSCLGYTKCMGNAFIAILCMMIVAYCLRPVGSKKEVSNGIQSNIFPGPHRPQQ